MEIIRDRNKRDSAIAVTVISMLLLLGMIFLGLKVPDPPIDDNLVMLISFGTDDQGQGDVQPDVVSESDVESEELPEEVVESNSAPVESVEDVSTQNVEETTSLPVENTGPTETETVVEEPIQEVDPKALYPGSSSNSSSSESQGDTGDLGDQGDPNGGDTDNNEGSPDGSEEGINLVGRSITFRPKLTNTTQETGKVVVNIWVDRYGKVKRATPGAKGTTTTNSQLHRIAKAAALKAKFSTNKKAPEEQKGTIVFEFLSGK